MRILFFMRSAVYVRNFESTLRVLAQRGHQVHIAAEPHHLDNLIARLCRDHAGITCSTPPAPLKTRWSQIGYDARRGLDYVRYLEPLYGDATKLRRRAELKAPWFLTTTNGQRLTATAGRRRWLSRLLRVADNVVPDDPAAIACIRAHRPDLVLVTPLVEPGSPQSVYVRAARALGIPTVLCVYSWDNLTNKGLVHEPLELVTVWNEAMRHEAITLHGIPGDRVIVTGAPAYDHWFTWTPASSRHDFCTRVGLDPARPYLLYLCSSKFIAPDELPFVKRWIADVRTASPALAGTGVLIRPHPQNAKMLGSADVSDLANVAIWPRKASNPVDVDSRSEYFDSIHHSAAVVGVNTSAQIESAIVGRGVHTLLAPEFRATQEGTLHFRHLRDVNGGLLHVAADLGEHVAQLEAAIARPDAAAGRCRQFVEAFVRPHGLDRPATPRLVDAIETVAARGPVAPARPRRWAPLARPLVFRTAAALRRAERGRAVRTTSTGVKRTANAQPLILVEKPKAEAKRLAAEAYQHYTRLRDCLRSMNAAAQPLDRLSASEQSMLAELDVLWNADPATISDLRAYAKAVTGARRSNYRGERAEVVRERLDRDLGRLLDKGDAALLVDEHPALGGFGVTSRGRFYNEETLRHFRVMSLLDDAAVLAHFRGADRRTVWEIGGGWGGFAWQFKRLCPNVTYLITGHPTTFLLSAVYLATLLPEARIRLYNPSRPDDFWAEWHTVDFAFAPEPVIASGCPPALDLTVDLDALARMSPARADAHVRRAWQAGSRHVFSICPSGDSGDQADAPVRRLLEGAYWPHAVSAPGYLDRRLAVRDGSYFLGWRRLRA
jgi:hypothetical protein